LGNGGHSNQVTPKQIGKEYFPDEPIKTSCHNNSSSVLSKNGNIYMFGRNERLQLV
jgi:alpha-tubulin suppressor-like RCC1 family protein